MNKWKVAHRKYLLTPQWKELRSLAVTRDENQCVECGATGTLHVHHKLYRDTFEQTRLEDLVSLCPACHLRAHNRKPSLRIESSIERCFRKLNFGEAAEEKLLMSGVKECWCWYEAGVMIGLVRQLKRRGIEFVHPLLRRMAEPYFSDDDIYFYLKYKIIPPSGTWSQNRYSEWVLDNTRMKPNNYYRNETSQA